LLLSGFKAASASALTVGSFGSNRPVMGSGTGRVAGSGFKEVMGAAAGAGVVDA
jgi:hypothetical protein